MMQCGTSATAEECVAVIFTICYWLGTMSVHAACATQHICTYSTSTWHKNNNSNRREHNLAAVEHRGSYEAHQVLCWWVLFLYPSQNNTKQNTKQRQTEHKTTPNRTDTRVSYLYESL